ncbi:MAG TPA: hypothetical protein VHC39_10910 [Rhizomicrobium sp.]|nr:hypothetical protein [Rhizomicrobium sp.]
MSVYNSELHAMVSSPSPAAEKVTSTATVDQGGNQDEGFFHHLLDVVNPLQHLPVIGTIYRAITGEHIGAVEKIAGDTLYGGLWGAVSSVADVAFEGVTGKSVEDTVLGWLKGDSNTGVAKISAPNIQVAQSLPSSNTPVLPSSSMSVASGQTDGPDVAMLSASLAAKGITGDLANRALDAYRRAIGTPTSPPVFASLN